MQKWNVTVGQVIPPSTVICDIDIPNLFSFGMDMEEGGKIVEINVVEGEECMAGQIIAVLVEDKEPEQML